MSPTKDQLVKTIASDIGFSQKKTSGILAVLLAILTETLAKGDSISIRRFGKFYVNNQKERKIRHPLTGQILIVGPKRTVRFKSFKFLREEVNNFEFDFDEFKRKNKIILQQLHDLIENSDEHVEENGEEIM